MANTVYVVCPHCDAVNRVPANRLKDHGKCGKCRKKIVEPTPLVLNQRNFIKHITRSSLPILVDFWAPWCGPCKTMAPAFQKAAEMLHPHVRLAKVNTETEQQIAGQYGIQSIPTMILFENGKEKARMSGALGASDIARWARGNM